MSPNRAFRPYIVIVGLWCDCVRVASPISQLSTNSDNRYMCSNRRSFSRHFHAVCRSPTASGKGWKCNSLRHNPGSIAHSSVSAQLLASQGSPLSQQSYLLLPLTLQLFSYWQRERKRGCENHTAELPTARSISQRVNRWLVFAFHLRRSEWEKSAFKDIDGVQCRLHNQLPVRGEGRKVPITISFLCGVLSVRLSFYTP